MRRIINAFFLILTIFLPLSAHAILSMELTRGVAGAIPIAVIPFDGQENVPQPIGSIISNDLANSGRFKVYPQNNLTQTPNNAAHVSSDYFRGIGTDNVLVGRLENRGNKYQISFELVDLLKGPGAVSISRQYSVNANELRAAAHHISDLVFQQLTGTRGVFSTKIAYVVVQRGMNGQTRYVLEVSDQDGYNPRALLTSPEPIMSPSWSPNGRQLAYVSFENRRASILIQDVVTGGRRLLSEFPGINGAPAWSPNGRQLALVLSKSGSPNIYVMDIASRSLRQVTKDFYINTEPSWSPDGRSLLFTSNRSGGPQIYQVNLATGSTSRLSYDGDYNARASYTRDGKHVTMIHRTSGIYNIAILDLETGRTRVLTASAGDSASPSIAPNGGMVLYDTIANGRNMLGMVSVDGNIQLVLPARNGEAQDPAWSPFLT